MHKPPASRSLTIMHITNKTCNALSTILTPLTYVIKTIRKHKIIHIAHGTSSNKTVPNKSLCSTAIA